MIKAFFFDFGNVLGLFDHSKSTRALSSYSPLSYAEVYEWCWSSDIRRLRETGKLGPKHFHSMACRELSLSEEVWFIPFCTLWGDIFSPVPHEEEVLQVLRSIPEETVRCITSNTEVLHWPYIANIGSVKEFFTRESDVVFRSYEAGVRKPDRNFFQQALDTVGLPARNVLFIDDVQEYVDVFKGMGGNAVQYDARFDGIEHLVDLLQTSQ